MNRIVVGNDISQLLLDSETLLDGFWKALRFRDPKCFHSPAYKLYLKTRGKRGWDGHTEFLSKRTGRFVTGLLPEIMAGLNNLKVPFELEDNRTGRIENAEITEDILGGVTLHDYQTNIANAAWESERGIIKAATGAGKTLLFTAMLKSIPRRVPVLVLFKSVQLVNQTYEVFKKNGIENIGRICTGHYEPNWILLTTPNSFARYEDLVDKFTILIADEVHEFTTNNSIKIFKKMKACRYRWGFSATPWDPKDQIKKYVLKSWFGPLIGDITTEELQGRNILSASTCYFHDIDEPDLDLADYAEAYSKGLVYNDAFHAKVRKLVGAYETGRILLVVERLDHGDALAQAIPGALWVQGKDDEHTRKYVIDKLCASAPDERVIAIASSIMNTGVDVKVHALFNCAGNKSYYRTIQRIGRGLRPASDKERLDYHDFYFTTNPYLEAHSCKRIKLMRGEGHPVVRIKSDGTVENVK